MGAASEPALTLGEVTAQATSRDDVDVDALRAMALDAVRGIDGARIPRGARAAVISVSLVRLESRVAAPAPAEVSCVVSATLRDRAGGSILAIVEGSARGQDDVKRVRNLERATMRAAVGSAIARVPEAMQRRRR